MERPSKKDAKLRLFNLDSIRAPGKAFIPMGLNAYEKADRVRLENRTLYTNFPSGAVEKICKRQKFICPACGQSLSNGEDMEVHHSPSLKNLRLHATPNTRVKTVALHKICHTRIHKESQKSSKI